MAFNDKFHELEEKRDISGLITLLNDSRWQRRYKALLSLINLRDSSAIEDVKTLINDNNSVVRETVFVYLRMNNAYPKTSLDDIKVYPYNIKNSYTRIKRIKARVDSNYSESSAEEEIERILKENASNLGANALIDVTYKNGLNTFFNGVKGSGIAVIIENTDELAQPKLQSQLGLCVLFLSVGLLNYLTSNLLGSFWLIMGIFFLFSEIFARKGYRNKTYFLGLYALIISFVLLIVNVLFETGLNNYYFDIFFVAIMIIVLSGFTYEYRKRKNNPKIPWKDEWGF